MSGTLNEDEGNIPLVDKTATFDRKLEELRLRGGFASVAARKADD